MLIFIDCIMVFRPVFWCRVFAVIFVIFTKVCCVFLPFFTVIFYCPYWTESSVGDVGHQTSATFFHNTHLHKLSAVSPSTGPSVHVADINHPKDEIRRLQPLAWCICFIYKITVHLHDINTCSTNSRICDIRQTYSHFGDRIIVAAGLKLWYSITTHLGLIYKHQ